MKNNKKIILIIVTFLVSIFLITNKAVAETVMSIDCPVDPSCKGASKSRTSCWYTVGLGCTAARCQPELHRFAKFTNNKGNSTFFYINLDAGQWGEYYEVNNCWINGGFNNIFDDCDEGKNNYEDSPYTLISKKICPVATRTGWQYWGIDWEVKGGSDYIAVGQTNASSVITLNDEVYIIYSFTDESGTERKIAEGYNSEGKYAYLGPDIKKAFNDEIYTHQMKLMYHLGVDNYFRVDNNFDTLLVAKKGQEVSNISICDSREDCEKNHNFKILLDSNDSNGKIAESVKEWFKENEQNMESLSDMLKITNDSNFINTCDNLNKDSEEGKIYKFDDGYSASKTITKLEEAYNAIVKAYGESSFKDYVTGKATSVTSSNISYIYKNMLGIDEIVNIAEEDTKEYHINGNYIVSAIKNDVNEALKNYVRTGESKINILQVSEDLNDYVLKFSTAAANIDSKALSFNLNSVDTQRAHEIREKFEKFINDNDLNIHTVTDCKGLLGQDLIDKINSYLDIIKIIVPILLIAFGILDFTKAMFAGEEDMKKAQKNFMTRLVIAILIFLTPTFVNFLLQLANKVWPIIEPSSCGIFE